MSDDLMAWLRRLYDRLRYRGQSVQYELQRMTHEGGWQNVYGATDDVDYPTSFSTPPSQPSFGPDTGYLPGKHRCIRRVGGHIETTLWTVKSPNTEEYYAQRREQAAAEAAAPSLDEVEADLETGDYETLIDWIEWKATGSITTLDDHE